MCEKSPQIYEKFIRYHYLDAHWHINLLRKMLGLRQIYSISTLKGIRSFGYYITTPIFYVNSSPHIGHVHTLLLADALNIYNRLRLDSDETIFSTGTDEHGIKIQTSAEAYKMNYQEFCDQNSKKFLDLFSRYDTTLTDFIRTSEARHQNAVKSVWTELKSKGFIYKSTYSGWYCSSDETFVPESQVSKKSQDCNEIYVDQHSNRVVWSSEENYMFRLEKFKSDINNWLCSKKPIIPDQFNQDAINMVNQNHFADISISRPRKRLSWGIQVPDDPSQTVYVWLDALINYLTIVGYPCKRNELKRWPIDCQVIGKDIIKFHAIYWPAFLLALSLPLPKQIVCHSHWLLDSTKMSKSRGNVVDPSEENKLFTVEGLRYYLLRAGTPHSDTDYSRTQAFRRVNAELADTYGNLISRCCAPSINPGQVIPTRLSSDVSSPVLEIKQSLDEVVKNCETHYDNANFYKGVDDIMSVLRLNNALYENNKPWKLIKEIQSDEKSFREYYDLQTITFETLRICSILLQPIVPKITSMALNRLSAPNRSWKDARVKIETGDPLTCQRYLDKSTESVLFRRLKVSETMM